MIRTVLLTSAITFAALPAAAQEGERSLLCNTKVAHTPLENVAHVPEAAEQGQQVVVLPPVIQIPLTVDLAVWLGLGTPAGTRMESVIGLIEVAKDGTVTFNGKDITSNVATACGTGAKASGTSSVTVDTDKAGGPDVSASSRDAEAAPQKSPAIQPEIIPPTAVQ